MPDIKRLLVTLALIAGLGWFGLHWYGKAREASVHGEILTEAISKAVAERKADLKADAQTLQNNRTALDSVRPKVEEARKHVAIRREEPVQNDKQEAVADRNAGADDAAWQRVFNDAVDAANRAAESAGSVSR